jgi:hypothetical protein
MTKSRGKGHNEITPEVVKEAARTGRDVCAILREMLEAAKKARDTKLQQKIVQAEKYLGCRNRNKRRSRR